MNWAGAKCLSPFYILQFFWSKKLQIMADLITFVNQ